MNPNTIKDNELNIVSLNNGVKMPIIGFGVYLIKGENCVESVKNAIQVGYRHIDTAQFYGNEKEVGEGIKLSGIPRNEIFVTTKVMTSGYEATKESINLSLQKFGFPYFDLILVHWLMDDNLGTYKALEEAYEQGKCKAIGLSNFNEREFLKIYNHFKTKPAVNQIETHLHFQQKKMHNFLMKYNCVHESWSPFGGPGANVLKDETLKVVAEKYGKTPAQIALRYLLHLGIIVIPKSANKNRMSENFNVFNFELMEQDIKLLSSLDTGKGKSMSGMYETFYEIKNDCK
jgi:diketogulonate reductase-like aldo/keto reductase